MCVSAPLKTFRALLVASTLSTTFLAGACSWDDIENLPEPLNDTVVGSVIVEPDDLQLGGIGDSVFLEVTVYDRANRELPDVSITWSVSDSDIATIDAVGLVRAVGLGLVTVTATAGDVDGQATIDVDSKYAARRACGSCHSTLIGDHLNLGFPAVSCWHCHNPAGETHRQFQNRHENASGGYDLLGAHVRVQCSSCHEAGAASLIGSPSDETDCVACHRSEYDAQHVNSVFPTTCISCHTPDTWGGATVDHPSISGGFDLIGVHAELTCTSCHVAVSYVPMYAPLDENDCITCHHSEYDSQHASTGYPTTCTSCHTPTTWSGATFDHSVASGGFDLAGPHTALACTSCHDAGTGEPLFSPADESDCIACHEDTYNRRHAGSGYPTKCLTCHNGITWTGATFNHDADYFPIFVGRHDGEWSSCSTCHEQADDFEVFTCFNCHSHNQADMDNEHRGRAGYAYSSPTCLGCHRNGEAP
jgi:hypothetical protein